MRKAIVNFANDVSWFKRGQERLAATIETHAPDCEKVFYDDFTVVGSPTHTESPYAFKVQALWNARQRGCDMGLYIDASGYLSKPLDAVWDIISREGFFVERLEDKHKLGIWCSDTCLANVGIDRETAMGIPALVSGVVGFDFKNPHACELLDQWLFFAKDGSSFQGAWVNDRQQVSADIRVLGHRHDQSVLSALVWKNKWPTVPFRTYVAYVNQDPIPETSCILLNPA